MILKIFSIYDVKAHAYFPPFFLPERDMAIRTFSDCCNTKTHRFGEHPEDYTLNEIGTFNDSCGTIVTKKPFIFSLAGIQLVKNQPIGKGNGKVSDETPILTSPESGDPTIQL